MTSLPQKLFNGFARYVEKPLFANIANQTTLARVLDALAVTGMRPLRGTKCAFLQTPNFRIRRMIPRAAQGNLLLFFHGGGFTVGSSYTHRWLAARIAAEIGAEAWLPDYRLAPAHPYPAAPDDCIAAYKLALTCFPPERIVLGGDSAGGTLVLNTVTRLAALGLPQPAALALLSPLTDLAHTSPSRTAFRDTDMLLPHKWVTRCMPAYLTGRDPKDPDISPAYADLSMAPPAALHVAEGEVLYDDAAQLAEILPNVDFHTWTNVPHVWQLAAGWTTEADASVQQLAEKLRTHLPEHPVQPEN
ncbi:Acetyl esterase/lipase [Litoreibacter ascidiaceicola]|uniref:Acetyl esterase/lipase n=1 Tax=Litoreibacter ascidiaceicola TaxID=1486859 RepID=A0A1M5EF95_9RHOB|nr:alpha/beta hydrolase fold domain-containing protein [Litoreibacter ascidiaceicola]SHF77963.1 Acetyl esterase/lipase [Litoreibacter ascidiaceicola]